MLYMVLLVKLSQIIICVFFTMSLINSIAVGNDSIIESPLTRRIICAVTNDQELCNGGAAIRKIGTNDCIIAVGAASVVNSGANGVASEIRLEKVAHVKAMAAFSTFLKAEVTADRNLAVDESKGQSNEQIISTVVEHSRMQMNNAKIAGTWYSADKSVLYEAIYFELTKKE